MPSMLADALLDTCYDHVDCGFGAVTADPGRWESARRCSEKVKAA